jgi:hypothetical protein
MDDKKQEITELLSRIRQILADTLTNNEEIKEILERIEELGLKVNLNFIALVGGQAPMIPPNMPLPFILKDGFGIMPSGELEFNLTDKDKDFLKDIGIKFEE